MIKSKNWWRETALRTMFLLEKVAGSHRKSNPKIVLFGLKETTLKVLIVTGIFIIVTPWKQDIHSVSSGQCLHYFHFR